MCNHYYWFERESGSQRLVDLALHFPLVKSRKEVLNRRTATRKTEALSSHTSGAQAMLAALLIHHLAALFSFTSTLYSEKTGGFIYWENNSIRSDLVLDLSAHTANLACQLLPARIQNSLTLIDLWSRQASQLKTQIKMLIYLQGRITYFGNTTRIMTAYCGGVLVA